MESSIAAWNFLGLASNVDQKNPQYAHRPLRQTPSTQSDFTNAFRSAPESRNDGPRG